MKFGTEKVGENGRKVAPNPGGSKFGPTTLTTLFRGSIGVSLQKSSFGIFFLFLFEIFPREISDRFILPADQNRFEISKQSYSLFRLWQDTSGSLYRRRDRRSDVHGFRSGVDIRRLRRIGTEHSESISKRPFSRSLHPVSR